MARIEIQKYIYLISFFFSGDSFFIKRCYIWMFTISKKGIFLKSIFNIKIRVFLWLIMFAVDFKTLIKSIKIHFFLAQCSTLSSILNKVYSWIRRVLFFSLRLTEHRKFIFCHQISVYNSYLIRLILYIISLYQADFRKSIKN